MGAKSEAREAGMSMQAVELEFGPDAATGVESRSSAVSWAAIAGGAVAISALTLILLAFGAGMGFMAASPWNSSPPSTTFAIVAGIYLLVVATLSSTVGGYLAGRLRTRWVDVHDHEVYFRDTAHGFLAWAFAAVISAGVLTSAATTIASSAGPGSARSGSASSSAAQTSPEAYYVDMLLRQNNPPANGGDNEALRGEVGRILDTGIAGDMSSPDRTYLAQVVAARSSLSQADAEKRIDDVIGQAKDAADRARKAAAALSFWLAASMLLGAFAASLAATEGGGLRDRSPARM
jgi:hypothetical protein